MAPTLSTKWSKWFQVLVETKSTVSGATWKTIICKIKTLHVTGGRAEWSVDMDPSLLTGVLENIDGTVDIKSGYKIRVKVTHHGATHQMFSGRVSEAVRAAQPNGQSTVNIHAIDDLGPLASTFLEDPRAVVPAWDKAVAYTGGDKVQAHGAWWKAAKSVPADTDHTEPKNDDGDHYWTEMHQLDFIIGIGDTFAERVNRILDLAGWPTTTRDIDTSLNWRLEGTYFGRSAMEELKLIAQSVGGWVYLSKEGKITTGFPDDSGAARWTVYAERNPADAHPICASAFQQTDNIEFVVNDIFLRMGGAGLSYATTRDLASQAAYGKRVYYQEGLQNLHHLSNLATSILAHGKDAHERLKSVTIPIQDSQSASMLSLFAISNIIELKYDNGKGDSIDQHEGYIIGWTVDIGLTDATMSFVTGHPLDVRAQAASSETAGGVPGVGGGSGGGIVATGPPGPTGPEGPRGIPGVRGSMWSHGTGAPGSGPPAPSGGWLPGDQWLHETTGELFLFQADGTWADEGVSILGPQGPRGLEGPLGAVGPTGSEGPTGPQGVTGPHGTAVHVLGVVATVADLPDPLGHPAPQDADVHFVTVTGDLMIFEHLPGDPAGGAWHDMGHVTGPQGIAGGVGPIGPTGGTGAQGPRGSEGHIGKDGPRGAHGAQGVHGTTGSRGIQGIRGPAGPRGPTGSISDAHGDARYYGSGNGVHSPWIVVSGRAPATHEGNEGPGCIWIQVA